MPKSSPLDCPFYLLAPADGDKVFIIQGPQALRIVVGVYDDMPHGPTRIRAEKIVRILNNGWREWGPKTSRRTIVP